MKTDYLKDMLAELRREEVNLKQQLKEVRRCIKGHEEAIANRDQQELPL